MQQRLADLIGVIGLGGLLLTPGCGNISIADVDFVESTGVPDDATADGVDVAIEDTGADASPDGASAGDGHVDGAADVSVIEDVGPDVGPDVDQDVDQDAGEDADAATLDALADAVDAPEVSTVTACAASAQCPPQLPHCQLPVGLCRACLVDGHCPGPLGRCEPQGCLPPRACSDDAGCSADGGVCGPLGFCVDCTTDGDCAAGHSCLVQQCLPTPGPCQGPLDCGIAAPQCVEGLCLACAAAADCPSGELCVAGLCTPPICKASDAFCLSATTRAVCPPDGGPHQVETCATGQGCDLGQCKAWVCPPGTKTCAGGVPTSCPANGLAWQVGTPCKAGELCIAGACTVAVCQPGQLKCAGPAKAQICAADGSAWTDAPCPADHACDGGACKPILCDAGAAFCVGETAWACSATGTSKAAVADCLASSGHCAEGACAPLPCKAGAVLCKGQQRLLCDSGSWTLQDCQGANDKCTVTACDPATKACKSGILKVCDDGNPCTQGACDVATGDCAHTPVAGPCDDGSACTTGDACVGGACSPAGWTLETWSGAKIAGHLDGKAATARFGQIYALAPDGHGAILVADRNNHRVRRVDSEGTVTTIAGSGGAGFADGPAAMAMLSSPSGVAAAAGWVAIGDRNNHRIRLLAPAAVVSTLAGSGVAGHSDGKGAAASLFAPEAVAFDGKGRLWLLEPDAHRLRRIDPDGTVTTIAGGGQPGGATGGFADGKGAAALLQAPQAVLALPSGGAVVADAGNHRLRGVAEDGTVTTLCGTGVAGHADGGAAAASLHAPTSLAWIEGGKALAWVDSGTRRLRRWSLAADGAVTTLFGAPASGNWTDGPAAKATLQAPRGLVAAAGGLVLGETQQPALRRARTGQVSCDDGEPCTIDACNAKTGACSHAPAGPSSACDDGDACTSSDGCSAGACKGKVKPCDDGNACSDDGCNPWLGACQHTASTAACDDGQPCTWGDRCLAGACVGGGGAVDTVAGGAPAGSDDGVGPAARLAAPDDIAWLPGGAGAAPTTLVVVDRGGHRLRKADVATWQVTTLAGGVAGFADGAGPAARFSGPRGLDAGADGTIVVADTGNQRIRTVSAAGFVGTLAGDGAAGFLDGPAAAARFSQPLDVAIAPKGDVIVADAGNRKIRRIDAAKVVTTLAGQGSAGSLDGDAKTARFVAPTRLVIWGEAVLVTDRDGHRVRRVALQDGATTTFVGSGGSQWVAGAGNAAVVGWPVGIGVAGGTRLWLTSAQGYVGRIEMVAGAPRLEVVAGQAGSGFADGTLATARLSGPSGVVASGDHAIIADTNNNRLRRLVPSGPPCATAATPCGAGESCDAKTGACVAATPAEGAICAKTTCAIGVCKAGDCVDLKPPACDDGKACTADLCSAASGGCSHPPLGAGDACCVKQPWSQGFEDALVGATLGASPYGAQWQRWQTAAGAAAAGSWVLKFGAAGDAEVNKPPTYAIAVARLPPVTLPAGTELKLTVQARALLSPVTSASRLQVRLFRGAALFQNMQFLATQGGWQTQTLDLSPSEGAEITIELEGRIAPGSTGVGWLVDALAIDATCKPKPCASAAQCGQHLGCRPATCNAGQCAWQDKCCGSHADCDDGKACTVNQCNSGQCSYPVIAECCESASQCTSGDLCLQAGCDTASHVCAWSGKLGCCHQDSDCDDGVGCTADSCAQNVCKHKDICCKSVTDCQDGEGCSVDACVEGLCQWTWKDEPGCCTPLLGPFGFEGKHDGWTRASCAATSSVVPTSCPPVPWSQAHKGWQVWSPAAAAAAGVGALYYGDVTTKTFAWGASAGTALSPPLLVQPGKSTLSFAVRYDTESGTGYDRLHAWLRVGGERLVIGPAAAPQYGAFWTKGTTAHGAGQWHVISHDVSGLAGKQIQLELGFNTVDGAGNSGLGVLIDDVRLVSTCGK